MNTEEPLEGEVLETMPVATPRTSTALATPAANPYLSMLENVVNRGGDVSTIDKLLDLQIKWEGNEARKAFVAAMARFKAEPMEILKRKLVEFNEVSYKHAELADVTDAVVPAMGKHGLSHRWTVSQESGQITVSCIITHELGHSESVELTAAPDNSGKKNAIQQVASAVTYLQRYTLLAATGMASKSMGDDDGRSAAGMPETPPTISEEQEIILRDLMNAYVKNPIKFLEWLKIEKLSDLYASNFDIAHNKLKELAKEKANG